VRPPRDRAAAPSTRPLALALLVSLAVSFLNPFGWRALWQPFDFFLHQRNEPIYRTILELLPLDWNDYWGQGLPFLMTGWASLLLWRWRRSGPDLPETVLCAGFTLLAFSARRFVGFYALVALPFVARDLEAWLGSRRWRLRPGPWVAAALTSVACVAVGLHDWTRPFPLRGIGLDPSGRPEAACDFIARNGVRGRAFNHFHFGGYLLWRFWPERGRLPFMDIHQAGSREDRDLYTFAQVDRGAWLELDHRHRFDFALLARRQGPNDRLLDWIEADSTWALVFADDVAALYVRRGGALEPVARGQGYRRLGAGRTRGSELGAACLADSALRAGVEAELERQIAASPRNATSRAQLGNLLLLDGRTAAAREQLERALGVDPAAPQVWARLGTISLGASDPARALREFRRERALNGPSSALDFRMGQAWQRLGDLAKARAAYRSAFLRDGGNRAAMDSLQSLRERR
jgi:tetratricopeptide (TPR) repeat protein